MRIIDADFCEELGATCIATRNKNGDLVAITSLDSIPTIRIERLLESESKHYADLAKSYAQGLQAGLAESEK